MGLEKIFDSGPIERPYHRHIWSDKRVSSIPSYSVIHFVLDADDQYRIVFNGYSDSMIHWSTMTKEEAIRVAKGFNDDMLKHVHVLVPVVPDQVDQDGGIECKSDTEDWIQSGDKKINGNQLKDKEDK